MVFGDFDYHHGLLRVLEPLPLREHALMQDSTDEDSIGICPIDDHMFSLLDAPVSSPDSIASAPDMRSPNQQFEAIVKVIEVTLCLAQAPPVHRVFGNLDQVEPGPGPKRRRCPGRSQTNKDSVLMPGG